MTDRGDAAHEAYLRLRWAQENRPTFEEMAALEKERAASARRAKIDRLRASVA